VNGNSYAIERCVEAATRRLRGDPELRADIACELRAHLDDRIEAERGDGQGVEESIQAALKAFGNPDEVGERIFHANLRRLKRRTILKWAARVTLLPAALVAVYMLMLTALTSGGSLVVLSDVTRDATGGPTQYTWITREEPVRVILRVAGQLSRKPYLRPDLSEDDLLMLREDPSRREDDARAMVERHPDDPVLAAHQALVLLSAMPYNPPGSVIPLDEKLQTVLDHGESLEPDNALYSYLKCALLLRSSVEVVENRSDVAKGEVTFVCHDRAMMDRAVAEFHKGNARTSFDDHIADFVFRKESLYRDPDSMNSHISRLMRAWSTLLPHLALFHDMSRKMPFCAETYAREERRPEALRILDEIAVPSLKLGASSWRMIAELVAVSMLKTRGHGAEVYRRLGLEELASRELAEAERWSIVSDKRLVNQNAIESLVEERGGLLMRMVAPVWLDPDPNLFSAWRRMEWGVFERLALTGLLAVGGFLVLLMAVCTGVSLLKRRHTYERGMLLFIGWRRMAWIIGLGGMAPLSAYILFTRFSPWGGMEYGVNYVPGQVCLQLTILGLVMSVGLFVTTYWAVRERCREAGMDVPEPGYFHPSMLWLIPVVGVEGLAVYAVLSGKPPLREAGGILLSLATAFFAFMWFAAAATRFATLDDSLLAFRRTALRTAIPLVAAFLLATGAVAHACLRVEEYHYARMADQPGQRLSLDEIPMSAMKSVRDQMIVEHREAMDRICAGRMPQEP
jgi:hypothetical protein